MNSKSKAQKNCIDDFNGYYEFLNNDFPTWVEYEGIFYPNVTTAFQAARTNNQQIRKKISTLENYDQFKTLVSSIKNPQGWYQNRYKVMEKLIRDKFKRNKQIANKLANTEERKLINCYSNAGENQMYWGSLKQKSSSGEVEYKGSNNLGKILEIVRADIIKLTDTQKWVVMQNLEEDGQLFPQVSLVILKEGQPIDKLLLENKNYFLFGSHPKCQFKLQHPSISKFHAAIFFTELQVTIVDTNSTHGTFIIKNNNKQKLEPLQKTVLQNGDTIVFGLSSRTYLCNIKFQKVEAALKRKQQQTQKNISSLSQVNKINLSMDKQQIKSKIGYKKYQGIHVRNINKNYSYNDIKQLFKAYGQIQKLRLIQDYKNNKFQGQVIVIYQNKHKIEDILKQISKSNNEQMKKFELIPVDKYDVENILNKNKQDRKNDRQKYREDDRRDDRRDSKRRSRSREKERKDKHRKYERQY